MLGLAGLLGSCWEGFAPTSVAAGNLRGKIALTEYVVYIQKHTIWFREAYEELVTQLAEEDYKSSGLNFKVVRVADT